VFAVSSSDDRTGLGQTGGGAVQMGVYWPREVWELARSAYVADLDCDPESPAVFARWLVAAIEEHLARTPAERAAISKRLDKHSRGRGTSRAHRVGDHLISAIEQAIITDRRELGRVVSRSRFVLEAATAAAAEARDRRGRPLPPPPRLLVNRPPRRP
jgi:hypothetical protein